MNGRRRCNREVWGAPIVLGVLSAAGLLSALLGDGMADAFSWVTLAVPVAASLWILRPPPEGSGR